MRTFAPLYLLSSLSEDLTVAWQESNFNKEGATLFGSVTANSVAQTLTEYASPTWGSNILDCKEPMQMQRKEAQSASRLCSSALASQRWSGLELQQRH